jgi:hypothetical protein
MRTAKQKQFERHIKALAEKPFEAMGLAHGAAEQMAQAVRERGWSNGLLAITEGWNNNRYSCWLSHEQTELGLVAHLWIRRHDSQPVRSWSDVQRIKREVVRDGRERVAVEVYPPDAEVVDQANMYHLWVMPKGFRLPFGLVHNQGEI